MPWCFCDVEAICFDLVAFFWRVMRVFLSGIRLILYLFNDFFLRAGLLIWLFWEHGLFSGAWAAWLCGSSVFLWLLGPSWCFSWPKGCHWELFFEPRGSLGRYVEGLGVPLGGFGAQSLLKTASLFHARYLFSDFGAKMGTGKVLKCSQKPIKNSSTLDQ